MDLIERQKAIDRLVSEPLEMNYGFYYAEKIKALPSAQPEIIRCKDCIYWWESHKMCKRNKDKNHNCACMDCDADFYCGNAERRTDEGD